ncbi:MAG TPA: hypothetical protein VHO69_09415 [Phototrophicaceae bacterium]|nr:hypothetical protein [Phototrophicaceae bacterium]
MWPPAKERTSALERRIAASAFAGLTQSVIINLYKETFALNFAAGKVTSVESQGFTDAGEIRIPPLVFAPSYRLLFRGLGNSPRPGV